MKELNHDRMLEHINKLYNEMLTNNKPFNSAFYMKVYAIMQVIYGIKPEYLNGLVVINHTNLDAPENKRYTGTIESLFGRAGYDKFDKKLVVYEDNINNQFPDPEEGESMEEYYVEKFCNVLQTLFHEYEHVFEAISKAEDSDEEAIFLKAVDQDGETIESYENAPDERLAELRSCKKILLVLENLGFRENKIYKTYENKIENVLKGGYYYEDEQGHEVDKESGTFTSPSGRYARLHNIDPEVFFEATDGIEDLHVRLELGLPMSEEEYYSTLGNSFSRK